MKFDFSYKKNMLLFEKDGYAYCVPYVVEGDTWFLKTIYPNRKFKYLIEEETYE